MSSISDSPIIKLLGANVRRLRAEHQLTQKELAELCNVDVMTISRIERDLQNTTVILLASLAQHLGVTPDALIK